MMTRTRALVPWLLAATPMFAACEPVETADEPAWNEPEAVGEATSAITVSQAASAGCSTTSVKGLSLQIIAQANCMSPGSFVEVPALPNVSVGSAVFPFLEAPARDAFVAAAKARPDLSMTVNSMLRGVAQQYLLYHWYQTGQCGIGLAAKPGSSNHETGLAIDINQYSAWKSTLQGHGFAWLGSSDPVHFDYAGPGAVSHKGADVLAFQTLWNKHHPEDLIDTDGVWGPQTEARLVKAPADGFPGEVTCDAAPTETADLVPSARFERAVDVYTDGASEGVTDAFVGDTIDLVVDLSNAGAAPAASVIVAIELDGDYVEPTDWAIAHALTDGAPLEADPAGDLATNPPHDASLPAWFDLDLGAFAAGETKQIRVTLSARDYSVDGADPVPVHAWVRKVDAAYAQDAFGGDVVNDGSQTFADGRLEQGLALDVYSHARWEWDSNRLEGATASDGDAVHVEGGAIVLAPSGDGALIATPTTRVQGSATTHIELGARRAPGAGPARLLVASDPEGDLETAASYELALPADGAVHTFSIDAAAMPALTGMITRVAFVPWDSGASGEAALTYLRVEGGSVPSNDDPIDGSTTDDDLAGAACTCSAVGAEPRTASGAGWLALTLVGAAGMLRRRRRVG